MLINSQKINFANSYKLIAFFLITVLLFLIFSLHVGATAPTITGNAAADMSTLPGVNHFADPAGDVGVPAIVGPSGATGWNILDSYVWYDVTTDKLYVGIHCSMICGDADGDGNPATTSAALAGIPGSDTDWGPGETAAFIINTNSLVNTNFNVVVGKRTNNSGIATWGIYYFNQSTELSAGVDSNWLLPDITDPARPAFIATTSVLAFTHDLEMVINQFSTLKGANLASMKIGAFLGSSTDDGIGEDTIDGSGVPYSIQKLTVIKKVVNDNIGTKLASDFPLSVDNGIGSVTTNVPVSVLTAIPYTVSETLQANYTQTSLKCVDDTTGAAVAHPVTFAAGQNVTCTITNDDIPPACIGDTVFEDLNGNAVMDTGETGIPNAIVTITLLDGSTKTTTTDANGLYSFCGLIPGTYTVKIDKTQTAIKNYPNFAYGYDSTTPQTYTQTLKSGDFYKDADFGYISYVKIGDQVFIDKDKNCIFDNDNKGVLGVKVNLLDSSGKFLQTTTTDANGFYYFIAVSNQTYKVEIDPAWKTLPALDLGTANCGTTKDTPKLTTHQTYLDADFGFDKAYPFDIHDPAQSQCLGVNIHFIIDIKNTSSLTATNVTFTDQLPDGINFVSFTSTSPSNGSSVSGNTLKVKFASMPGNSTITMNVVGFSTKAGSGLTNTSFASDDAGLLISHVEKANIQILDSVASGCKLPDTGASRVPWLIIALTMLGLGTIGYKVSRWENLE